MDIPWDITIMVNCVLQNCCLKEDGSVQLIRRAETLNDYFATFDCFEIGETLNKLLLKNN